MVMVDDVTRSAVLSRDDVYRYLLSRRWAEGDRILLWLMLNPSTADAKIDDPTIKRCMAFGRRWGYDAIEVVNLFAFRATNPKDLTRAGHHPLDMIGPENDSYIREAYKRASRTVAAWGAHPIALPRSRNVFELFDAQPSIYCLGRTKDGSPRHPLYVHGDQPLLSFKLKG